MNLLIEVDIHQKLPHTIRLGLKGKVFDVGMREIWKEEPEKPSESLSLLPEKTTKFSESSKNFQTLYRPRGSDVPETDGKTSVIPTVAAQKKGK